MFDPQIMPRVFGSPLGSDFLSVLVDGLHDRLRDAPPQEWARVEIFVNTARMRRRLKTLLTQGPARVLPKIRLITDLVDDPVYCDLPPAVPPLQRRLEIAQLVGQLIDQIPDLAPQSAVFDLSDSLANLMGEMQFEGVDPADLRTLDVTDVSGHWDRALKFINIVQRYFERDAQPDSDARLRATVMGLISAWETSPPTHPIILAGSTGSRGTTYDLMSAVAALPQGAVILPGFDFDLPQTIWESLANLKTGEDHPQFRFARLMADGNLTRDDIAPWSQATGINHARNRLVSLALRPAPMTHHWLREGPHLTDLDNATQGITWVEAPDQRIEALSIALRLRQAVDQGKTAAVITPDRNLTRRIASALGRWDIVPDDSAGVPLTLTAPARFLLHVLDFAPGKVTAENLLVMLKHPLTHTGKNRGDHLLFTHDLEAYLRREGPAFLTPDVINTWAAKRDTRLAWADWLNTWVFCDWPVGDAPLQQWLSFQLNVANQLANGPSGETGGLWEKGPGRATLEVIENLQTHADTAGDVSFTDYSSILRGVLNTGEARDHDTSHPNILIWGTLEARVQGADLVILAGLNEGSWPETPNPDPWLNRSLRQQAGLLLPERRIGLSAHDFQQAIGAAEVWVTRSLRSDDAETVPSRWLNRIENLLTGLDDGDQNPLLTKMKSRGAHWTGLAHTVEQVTPEPNQTRPSVAPPSAVRPQRLTVTEIKTLIRDPYSIYAKHVLKLRKLDPLVQTPDAPLRGTVIHNVMAAFTDLGPIADHADGRNRLLNLSRDMLTDLVPWPAARRSWQARITRFADWFVQGELTRQSLAKQSVTEIKGDVTIPKLGFTLAGTADRIDMADDGRAWIYDYKTGNPPSKPEQTYFDKQLLLEVEMARFGAFEGLGPLYVIGADYIGLGAKPVVLGAPIDEADVWTDFTNLIATYQSDDQGYTARRAMLTADAYCDYDHLSRFGEWGTDRPAITTQVT